jgi:putative hydrolase of the HAD superfamily
MTLRAVFLDLGDVIMDETTEEKIDGVTQRADLVPGMADLIRHLHVQGVPLAIVADTRDGTYRNVLGMHGLFDLFDAFAISDQLGTQKPDAAMFRHVLDALEIPLSDWQHVVMVGNNLARDIRGANALGLISVWMAWNQRYPIEPADEAEKPKYQVGSAAELGALLEALRQNADSKAYEHPVPFPWGHTDS